MTTWTAVEGAAVLAMMEGTMITEFEAVSSTWMVDWMVAVEVLAACPAAEADTLSSPLFNPSPSPKPSASCGRVRERGGRSVDLRAYRDKKESNEYEDGDSTEVPGGLGADPARARARVKLRR